jgi:hypothetical protein
MDRLEFVRRKLVENPAYKNCFYCEYSRGADSPAGEEFCILKRKAVKSMDICDKWQIRESFVKIIAFKTSLYEKETAEKRESMKP